jgi:hypothetical protein
VTWALRVLHGPVEVVHVLDGMRPNDPDLRFVLISNPEPPSDQSALLDRLDAEASSGRLYGAFVHAEVPKDRPPESLPFASRLRIVLQEASAPAVLPVHERDQVEAASDEARDAALQGRRHDWGADERQTTPEARAYLDAALMVCSPCPQVDGRHPQPLFVLLAYRRIVCEDCLAAVAKDQAPPASDADRCDLCETRGITDFMPINIVSGPITTAGDICKVCAIALGFPWQDPR